MNIWTSIYTSVIKTGDSLPSPLLLLMRIYWGGWYVHSGYIKLTHFQDAVEAFEQWHILLPRLSLSIVMATHLVGGICLIIGLWSRWVSLPLALTMIVAYLTVHKESVQTIFTNPSGFIAQDPFLFLLTNVMVILFGAGKYSLDEYLRSL